MDKFKDILTNKLTLRCIYIAAAYSTSHIVALIASPKVASTLSDAGLVVQITDPMKFKTAITAGMLLGGEFVYHFIHEKFILPHVAPQSIPLTNDLPGAKP